MSDRAEYYKAYRLANREKKAEYQIANKEKIAEYDKAYYLANKDKRKEQVKDYYLANKEKVAEKDKSYRLANKEKIAARDKAYSMANKEKKAEYQKSYRLANNHKKKYGITLEECVLQFGTSCNNCGHTPVEGEPSLHTDHCHETGKLRGRLCTSCNLGVGQLGDNIEGLESAIRYLQRSELR